MVGAVREPPLRIDPGSLSRLYSDGEAGPLIASLNHLGREQNRLSALT